MSQPDRHETIIRQFCESSQKHLGLRVRGVQVEAAKQLLGDCVVEMATGEGKTLTTALAACLLRDRYASVFVATANDYLAHRDAAWMAPVLAELGHQTTALKQPETLPTARTKYAGSIVYGTIRDFGFDHLRRRIAARAMDAGGVDPMPLNALIVDEADSVLIDEARTPLVISQPTQQIDPVMASCCHWAAETARLFESEKDFVSIEPSQQIALTEAGHGKLIHVAMPAAMDELNMTQITHALEQAIWVRTNLHDQQHYLVREGRVVLIQQYSGRTAENRTFAAGVQQAIEAREGVALTASSQCVAKITVQSFTAQFDHLCGITATATEDAHELKTVYGLRVVNAPSHQPSALAILPPKICQDAAEKRQGVFCETREMIKVGRAVLIGTRDIQSSEDLSTFLNANDVQHVVLNAKNPKAEAEIVAKAGQRGNVTVATNMAGRGTDIPLSDEVRQAGGLHVIVLEAYAAARIDRQLMGRAGRQGDPGSARLFVSPEDGVLEQAFGDTHSKGSGKNLAKQVSKAQALISKHHRLQRSRLTARESAQAKTLRQLGLDPVLDPLPEDS